MTESIHDVSRFLKAFIESSKKYVIRFWEQASDNPNFADRDGRFEVPAAEYASVVSSELDDGYPDRTPLHRVVLDIDWQAELVPSTTPGHYHLYINKAMTWDQYVKLLDVMAEVGLLQQGYVTASKVRKATMVRLPWIKK